MKRLLVIAVLVAGCSGNQDSEIQPCSGEIPESSTISVTLTHDGIERRADVYFPPSYDGVTPHAVVFNFHGLGSNASEQAFYSNLNTVLQGRGGYVAVYPEGIVNGDGDQAFNGGICCGTEDDVGFTDALIEHIATSYCVDRDRVYATGMSNGGIMSWRLACDLSTKIAAIVPVAGINLTSSCQPERAIPVLHFHGTDDTTVPYDGFPPNIEGVIDGMTSFAALHGCTATPTETFRNGDVHCDTWDCDPADFTVCTVDGGGHTWPGAIDVPSLGYTTHDVNASEALLDFYEGAFP